MFKITAAFCLVWATLSLIILASREGEGWDLTMQIPETAAILTTFDSFPSAVNQHGETPSFGCGHWQRSDQVRKRSLLRALRRAYVHGHTWYRGQQYTFATLQRAHPYLKRLKRMQDDQSSDTLQPSPVADMEMEIID